MKLEQEIRQRLFAGASVELPLDKLANVRQDGVYAIHTDKGTRQGQFRVLFIRGGKALIRYEGDPVRLLAQGGDYTDFEGRALREEPEAVDEETQRQFAENGRERFAEARPRLHAARENRTRLKRLEDIQRKATRRGKDLTPFNEVLDRVIAEWRAHLETEEAA